MTKPDLVSVKTEPVDTNKPNLESRVASRKRELVEELIEHKKRTGISAVETVDALKRRLTQLDHLIKQNVVDGWMNVGDSARAKFELWIDQ